MELSIDTSTRYASIALTVHGELRAELSWRSDQNHTRELAPAVQALLRQAGATTRDIAAVAVALGPGGFSALRVGLSFAKGLAEGLGVPLVGMETLEVEAFPYASTGLPVYATGDAGRGQLAWAAFLEDKQGWRKITGERIATPQELAEALSAPGIICGEGLAGHGAALRPLLPQGVYPVQTTPPTRRAATLARLGWERLTRGEQDDPATLQPLYLRRPSITMPRGHSGA